VLAGSWLRKFFELDLPRLVVLLAGVGIVGLTGGVLYGSLRAVGWIQQVPGLLRIPAAEGEAGLWPVLRRITADLSERARRIGEPLDPGKENPPRSTPPTDPPGRG
jgi:hypothetical protein